MLLEVSSALFNETLFPESPGNRHPFSRDSQRSGKTQFPGKFSNPGIPDFNPSDIGTVLDSYLGPYTSHMVLNRVLSVPMYLRMFSYSNVGPIRPKYGHSTVLTRS